MEPTPGTTKTVIYKSASLLDCYCGGNIIICVDPDLTYNCAPYIEGHLDSYVCGADTCGRRQYTYYISYDSGYLADPTSQLYAIDISGILCRNCLTEYLDYKAPFFSDCDGVEYTYKLPGCVPQIGATLTVEAVNGTEVILKWSACS